jgi:hypothetical protein
MVRLSYLNGTLKEKDAVLNRPLAVKISLLFVSSYDMKMCGKRRYGFIQS